MHPSNPFGPFLRRYPTTATTVEIWRYCYVFYDTEGREVLIEWH
jgi:hypothetical protein